MKKPFICFDFDGTLVDKNGRIHPNDIAILKHEKRAVFVPATGRPLHAVRRAFVQNGLTFESAIPFPMILQNGAVVYQPHEQLWAHTPFSTVDQAKIIEIAQRNPQVCCLLFSLNQLDIMWPNEDSDKMIARFDLDMQPYQSGSQQYTKITFIAGSHAALKPLAAKIEPLSVETAFSLPTVYELTPTGIDKGHMLRKLLDGMGMRSAKLLVVGDGENDLSLFDVADVSFCPVGSVTAVTDKADILINVKQSGLLAPILQKARVG
jgi:Cof subfamily protein (haloacid dehalogenase superfamily)